MAQTKKLMAMACVTLLWSSVTTSAQDATSPYISDLTNPGKPMAIDKDKVKDQITSFEELQAPFTHAVTLQGREGIAYVSTNGRFFLRGVIFDTWTGKTIQTMEELKESKRNLNLDDLGVKEEDVKPMYYGSGPKKVTIFVDPLCPFCGQLFDQMIGDPSYARDYTFQIFNVPYLGEKSTKAVTVIECVADREAALKALLTKDQRWMMSQPAPDNCDPQPIMQRTIMAQVLGVSGVPFLIGPDGGIARGLPADLKTFLATN